MCGAFVVIAARLRATTPGGPSCFRPSQHNQASRRRPPHSLRSSLQTSRCWFVLFNPVSQAKRRVHEEWHRRAQAPQSNSPGACRASLTRRCSGLATLAAELHFVRRFPPLRAVPPTCLEGVALVAASVVIRSRRPRSLRFRLLRGSGPFTRSPHHAAPRVSIDNPPTARHASGYLHSSCCRLAAVFSRQRGTFPIPVLVFAAVGP